MGLTDKVWAAMTAMVKLEDKVQRLADAAKSQQLRIENLTERVIRFETQLEMLMGAAAIKQIKGD